MQMLMPIRRNHMDHKPSMKLVLYILFHHSILLCAWSVPEISKIIEEQILVSGYYPDLLHIHSLKSLAQYLLAPQTVHHQSLRFPI